MNIKTAVIHFLANEFKLDPSVLGPDLQFAELGLNAQQTQDLLNRLQEALDLSLPEDKLPAVQSIEDLFTLIDPDPDSAE